MDPLYTCYWTVICSYVSCKRLCIDRVRLYLQQELVSSRKMIKWSTPTTRMDRVQTGQIQDWMMERKTDTMSKRNLKTNLLNVLKVKLVVSMNKHNNVHWKNKGHLMPQTLRKWSLYYVKHPQVWSLNKLKSDSQIQGLMVTCTTELILEELASKSELYQKQKWSVVEKLLYLEWKAVLSFVTVMLQLSETPCKK